MKVRNLARGLLLLAVLTPGATWCTGLGDITISTALNQPLRADIRVLSVEPDDIENMQAALASQQVFERVGIERPFALTQLQFNVVPASDDGAIIQVTTREPVREPFLNFLIDLRWPDCRLVREYTVLLDPPVLMDEQGILAQAPFVRAEATRPQTAAGNRPAASRFGGATGNDTTAADELYSSAGKVPGRRPATHTVVPGDTLGEIAQRYRTDERVELSRMVVAIGRANPDTFAQGNINDLRTGIILRMPDPREIAAVESAAAVAEIARQERAWEASRALTAGESVPTKIPSEEPSATETAVAKDATSPDSDKQARLKIMAADESAVPDGVASAQAVRDTSASSVNDTENNDLLLRELAESRRVEIDSLQTRVSELESMLSKQERVISLQSEALADLQARLDGNGVVAEPGRYDDGVQQGGAVADATAQVRPDAATFGDTQATTETASETQEGAVLDEPVSPPAESDSLNAVLGNPVMLVGAGAAGLLLLALIWLIVKRAASRTQRIDLANYVDNDGDNRDQAGPFKPDASAIEPAQAATAARAHVPMAINPMAPINEAPDKMPSARLGAPAAQPPAKPGHDDTLAEADVYIAYGLHQQGEDLLREAIGRNPERIDYRLKLLEIYYAGRNHAAFDAQAKDLFGATGGRRDAAWERVLTMGLEIDPRNPLYGGSEADANAPLQATISEDQATRTESRTGVTPQITSSAAGFAFAPDERQGASTDSEASLPPAESTPTAYNSKILEFDLGDFDGETAADASATPSDSLAGDRKDEMSFDLSELESADESADLYRQSPTTIDSASEYDPDASLPGSSASLIELDADSIDEASFSIEVASGETEDAESLTQLSSGAFSEQDLNPDNVDDLSDINEVGTKLDLARAYIDMCDADGALSTLEEVLQDGDDDQREQAETLMRQIA
ncbi:MAG: hypothetical protein H0V62_05235 [Gammaproteobacteria bacterium]|nr:hypothetical protein [Gammaproteobacteria bacterium]